MDIEMSYRILINRCLYLVVQAITTPSSGLACIITVPAHCCLAPWDVQVRDVCSIASDIRRGNGLNKCLMYSSSQAMIICRSCSHSLY